MHSHVMDEHAGDPLKNCFQTTKNTAPFLHRNSVDLGGSHHKSVEGRSKDHGKTFLSHNFSLEEEVVADSTGRRDNIRVWVGSKDIEWEEVGEDFCLSRCQARVVCDLLCAMV